MKRPVVVLLVTLLSLPAVRADDATDVDRKQQADAAARILRAGLLEQYAFEMLTELCETAPRRLSGSKEIVAAEAWAQRAMREAGLARIRLDPVTVPHWVRGDTESLLLGHDNTDGGISFESLPILALGGSIGTPEGGITAGVIEVQDFEELERRADEAKGKIVFFNRPMDPTLPSPGTAYGRAVNQRTQGAIRAAKAGGVAALVRSLTTRLDDVPHTGVMGYADGVERIPAAAVSTRGAERLSALLRQDRVRHLQLRLDCRILPDTSAHTVIGEFEGTTRKDEIVLLGAHLDAWDVGQGAHDDGAGCVQVIEAVRLLASLGLRPRRTIRVVLYACEEQGIFGGRAYAKDHADELSKHVFALESDGGGFTPRGFSTNANDDARTILASIAEALAGIGASRVTKGGGGADVAPLAKAGVVLAGYRPDPQRYFDVHHAVTDSLDAVNPRELELGAIAIATLAYAVADLEETLPRNPTKRDE